MLVKSSSTFIWFIYIISNIKNVNSYLILKSALTLNTNKMKLGFAMCSNKIEVFKINFLQIVAIV